jgi:5-oxoprolinase (ATP-hydrolysing)
LVFDMGGTSIALRWQFSDESRNAVLQIGMRAPMMSIHTVAAGGGSILAMARSVGLRVQVCQPRAGQLPARRPAHRTDANVMTGKIQPDHFLRCSAQANGRTTGAARWSSAVYEPGRTDWRTAEAAVEGFTIGMRSRCNNAIKKIR